jgi:hypothetical protein
VWSYLFIGLGWHKNPATANLFAPIVMGIQPIVMIWALRQTAAEGRGYGGQVVAGILISLVASVIVLIGNIICVSVVFPHYLADTAAATQHALLAAGKSQAEVQQVMDMTAKMRTPMGQGLFGMTATIACGLVFSLILAAFIRAKHPSGQTATA